MRRARPARPMSPKSHQYSCPDHGRPVGLMGTVVPELTVNGVELVSVEASRSTSPLKLAVTV
jgi:hypothetical protein